MLNVEKLKHQIKIRAKENDVSPQELMQMYFFERLLCRISLSGYKNNFILKGGLLLSAIIGNERRTTADMDTMVKGIDVESDELLKIIDEIINTDCSDGIKFKIDKTKDIRIQDAYGGVNVKITALCGGLKVPLSIDVTTKDPITPREIEYKYKCMFDNKYISIMAFNKETIIAEKFETLIRDTETNTRAKDFYDLYIIVNMYWDEIDKNVMVKAIKNTCKRRETLYILDELNERYEMIENSKILNREWVKYKNTHLFASNIEYADIMIKIFLIVDEIKKQYVNI